MENLELRMYSLVLYNISPIQQGIQAYHATIEATQNFNEKHTMYEDEFNNWAKNWKTVIILNGGTTTTMTEHYKTLVDNDIQCNKFHEPDLNNSLTAISFIVDERVFNKEKYPDYIDHDLEYKRKCGIIGLSMNDIHNQDFKYKLWLKSIGGEQNTFLRTFLSKFKLA